MKIAISATLFAAYFVFVHSAPVAAPSEQLVAREVEQVPPPFGTSQNGEWGWLRRKPDGTLVTKREVPPPLFSEWRNTKREVEAIPPPPFSNGDWGRRSVEAIPPPPFSNGDWGRRSVEDRDVQAIPPPPFSNWPRSAESIPPFTPKDWVPSKRSTEGVESIPPFAPKDWTPAKRSTEGVEQIPPPFELGNWPNWDKRSVQARDAEAIPPPLFGYGDWIVDGSPPGKRSIEDRAVDAAPVWVPDAWFSTERKRDVENADKEASPEELPLWTVGGVAGWERRRDVQTDADKKPDTEGVAYPQEAPIWGFSWGISPREPSKRDTEEVAYTEEAPIWWSAWGRPRREVEERAEPPLFPGIDWRERREVPPPFLGHTWIDAEAEGENVAEIPPPPIGGSNWVKRADVDGAPGVFYGTSWAKREIPPPFNGEIGWRLRNPTGQQADVEEREVPPPFDFREWNWAGKRLAEAEAKAAAAKRMIPPPSGSEFNVFTGGNGWPSPRAEKRMIPPPSGSEFNVFTGGNGWPSPRAE